MALQALYSTFGNAHCFLKDLVIDGIIGERLDQSRKRQSDLIARFRQRFVNRVYLVAGSGAEIGLAQNVNGLREISVAGL
jgi:hypothetical protein